MFSRIRDHRCGCWCVICDSCRALCRGSGAGVYIQDRGCGAVMLLDTMTMLAAVGSFGHGSIAITGGCRICAMCGIMGEYSHVATCFFSFVCLSSFLTRDAVQPEVLPAGICAEGINTILAIELVVAYTVSRSPAAQAPPARAARTVGAHPSREPGYSKISVPSPGISTARQQRIPALRHAAALEQACLAQGKWLRGACFSAAMAFYYFLLGPVALHGRRER